MSQSILTRLDYQAPINTSSQAGGCFPPSPPQVALCLAGVIETGTPVFHSPNRTDGHAVMETASRFPYGPQPSHSLGEIWQKRNKKAVSRGTDMYISKDNFSCASTRYCKSSGLSITPSLSPILKSHWATAGSIRLFTSRWQDSYSSSSCVLKFKAKEKAHASFSGRSR